VQPAPVEPPVRPAPVAIDPPTAPVAVPPAAPVEPTITPEPSISHEPSITRRDPQKRGGAAKPHTPTTLQQVKPANANVVAQPDREIAKPVVDPTPTPTPPKPVVDPTPPVPPRPEIDTAALYGLYGAVGQDLATARKARGPEAVTAIESQYRRIQIQDAGSTPAKRAATAAILRQLRGALAPLTQPR
jgi:hypothetical protein